MVLNQKEVTCSFKVGGFLGFFSRTVASEQAGSGPGICAQIKIPATQSQINGGNWTDVPQTVPVLAAACIYLL